MIRLSGGKAANRRAFERKAAVRDWGGAGMTEAPVVPTPYLWEGRAWLLQRSPRHLHPTAPFLLRSKGSVNMC